ncbi:hypothetical protein QTP70_010925 [Hemibagrus guttatus]|uniref:Uncharacterized protein n=1 Tax=Hemibagrus guttatus TaxID=175788 RepID=A0AAE0QMN7_9TELE|nr:hypothetical protein QTP70_010925 [Hemibagrus guttatus]KAK3557858.1 hypothetical protein QTP86_003261 [Hemibagrus guttatus]
MSKPLATRWKLKQEVKKIKLESPRQIPPWPDSLKRQLEIKTYALCMDPTATASSGPTLQNTLPTTDPAELREIIVRQGALIRSYQDQVEPTLQHKHRRTLMGSASSAQ